MPGLLEAVSLNSSAVSPAVNAASPLCESLPTPGMEDHPSLTPKYRRGTHPHSLRNLIPRLPGSPPLKGSGRKAGSKNFKTILREAEPDLAEAYVAHAKSGNGALLHDSRKVFVPIDSDHLAPPTVNVLTLLVRAHRERLSPPTTRIGFIEAETKPSLGPASTLNLAAATVSPSRQLCAAVEQFNTKPCEGAG